MCDSFVGRRPGDPSRRAVMPTARAARAARRCAAGWPRRFGHRATLRRPRAALRREYARRRPRPSPTSAATRSRCSAGWFDDAVAAGLHEPNAMVVATVSADGRPSSRMVLLKGFDERGFVFFTNSSSRKGRRARGQPARARCSSRGTTCSARSASTGTRRAGVRGGDRGLLRHPPAGVAARRLGLAASRAWWPPAPRSTSAYGGVRRGSPSGRRAAAAVLGRLPGRARGGGVLAGPQGPDARPARLPPRPPGRTDRRAPVDGASRLAALSPSDHREETDL